MKVIITGGTGFLGKRLASRLSEIGFDVLAIGRCRDVGDQLSSAGIPFESVDLTNLDKTISIFQGADMVVHCAALSSPWGTYREFYRANVDVTKNVISACQQCRIKRLIHVSTPSIYFDGNNRFNVNESEPLPAKSINNYATTKRLAEKEVERAFKNGLDTITIRPRGIFGAGDTSIFPRLIMINKRGILPLINQGRALVDLTHVDNVVEALVLCLRASRDVAGETFNITNADPRPLFEILTILFEAIGEPFRGKRVPYGLIYYTAACMETLYRHFAIKREPPLTRYSVGVIAKSMTLDISKAQKLIGYEPVTSIEDGIEEFAKWWRSITSE